MEPRRRQQVTLAALVVLLGVVTAYQFWPASAPAPATETRAAKPARTAPGSANRARPQADVNASEVVDVGITRLSEPPPDIGASGRNPFRFRPKAPPPPPPTPQRTQPVAVADATPPPPPPPPPITLKFIGVVSGQAKAGRVAVLSDGKFVYYGHEGDIIEGRYRVVKIGEESVQMEYVDGRGRQTIRLSGA